VRERGATRVVLRCHRSLVGLLSRSAGVDCALAQGDALPSFDVHSPLMSLPATFRTSLSNIPAETAYLSADPTRVDDWRRRLAADRLVRVGLFWRGNRDHHEDVFRSIPLDYFAPLFEVPGCSFYSLQKDAAGELATIAGSRFPIIDLSDQLTDFHETAALTANLDLVIGCDSAPAHLAGALGVPIWLALPAAPDWRWLLEREDSPWYPTMRLFRQQRLGDWVPVFARAAAELRSLVAARRTD